MDEILVMRVLQFNPVIQICFLGKYKRIHPLRILTDASVTIALCGHVWLFMGDFHSSIWHFVLYMLAVSLCVLFIAYLITSLKQYTEPTNVCEIILEIDALTNYTSQNHWDWMLNFIAGTYLKVDVLIITFILFKGLQFNDVPYFALVVFCNKILEVALLKYLLAKRLRYLRSAEEYMTRVEDTIFFTRQLLECNTTLNTTYGLLAASYTIYTFQLSLQVLYSCWADQVAKIEGVPHEHYPVFMVTTYCTICMVTFLLAVSSSYVRDQVDEVVLELDITYSARGCSEYQEKLVKQFYSEILHYQSFSFITLAVSVAAVSEVMLGPFRNYGDKNGCLPFVLYKLLESKPTFMWAFYHQGTIIWIHMFLMELRQTPVEMSALGLYEISRPSISTACTIFISYLLVLIQYT